MNCTIDAAGIHYSLNEHDAEERATDALADRVARERDRVTVLPDTANDIPLNEAIAEMGRISAGLPHDLCECLQQGATPCGACGTPPARR